MKTLSLILLQLTALPAAAALTINCTPGSFRSRLLEEGLPEDGKIIVAGSINAADMIEMASLDGMSVDLSNCKVASFTSPKPYLYDRHSFAADEIPDYAFAGSTLKSIVLPGSVVRIGDGAFLGSRLESLTVSEGTRIIGDYAMRDCSSLKDVKLPQSVTEIGKECFAGCKSIGTLTLSSTSLKEIPERIVAGCEELISISWPPTVSNIAPLALADSKVLSIRIDNNVKAAPFALAHTSLEYPHLPLIAPASSVGILLNSPNVKGMNNVWSAVPAAAFAGLQIPYINGYMSEASEVGAYAFYGNVVSTVTLSENITSLDKQVFGNVPLTLINVVALKDRIPAVTSETFEGHNLSEIKLIVDKENAEQWETADVWREFNIITDNNSLVDIEADSFGINLKDGLLTLNASREMTEVIVADEGGRVIATASPGSQEATIRVNDGSGRVIIVTTRFADLTSRTDKIIK